MSTTPTPTPDYGEPWRMEPDSRTYLEVVKNRHEITMAGRGATLRAVQCVNACAGMADPAAEIQAMRDIVAAAQNCRHWHDCSYNPETGKTEGVIISTESFWDLSAAIAKLQPFISP
jgi:hypothetical protein